MHKAWAYIPLGVLLSAGSAAPAAVTIPVSGDVYVDTNAASTNTGTATVIAMRSAGNANAFPTQFPFMEFTLGSNTADSVVFNIFNVTARGATDGIIYAKPGNLAAAAGASETSLTFSNSFLGTWPPATGTVDAFITAAGWTALYTDATLATLGNTTNNTPHSFTSSGATLPLSALKDFYNANLGQTITILFRSRAPVNGNNVTWSSREGASGGASLTVVEIPEPATLALLLAGVPLLVGRRRNVA